MTTTNNASELPCWTLNELITRYELEPTVCDLFVEGQRDQNFYRWYLNKVGRGHVSVLHIDSVEITRENLERLRLSAGNRNRIIALALLLDTLLTTTHPCVRCVADSDFDFVLQSRICSSHLVYTDYTSIELYSYDIGLLSKALSLALNVDEGETAILQENMSLILRKLFIVRAANQRLKLAMKFPSFLRCCHIDGNNIVFNRDEFVFRSLNSNQYIEYRDAFESTCQEIQAVQLKEFRESIHADDYLELLGWYLHSKHGWIGYRADSRSAYSILMPALDDRELARESLFIALESIFR